MPASGWTLSPAVTHIFLTHTLEQKSPLFILRCMRSFCDTEHNPFFIILTGFKGMWLFQCDFPIVFVFVLLSSFVSLAFSMTSLDFLYKSYSYEYLLTSLPEEVLEESSLFPEVFPFHVTSCFCSFCTLLYGYPFCCVCLIWKLPMCYQRWNAERRGEICYIPHICSISSQMKWSHQAPFVRAGMNQTPLCCVHAIPGASFCPQQLSI